VLYGAPERLNAAVILQQQAKFDDFITPVGARRVTKPCRSSTACTVLMAGSCTSELGSFAMADVFVEVE
jgi:hypothetical protein